MPAVHQLSNTDPHTDDEPVTSPVGNSRRTRRSRKQEIVFHAKPMAPERQREAEAVILRAFVELVQQRVEQRRRENGVPGTEGP
jgi:hypothetical protein